MKEIIIFITAIIISYYICKLFHFLIDPKTYYKIKVLKLYEFHPNNQETIDKINQFSCHTGLYATSNQHEPPKDEDIDNGICYTNYKINKNMNAGGGLSYDTRTGEFITRVALWKRC